MTGSPPSGRQPSAASGSEICLYVEQLRRAVPGGIGTYARGLVKGLDEIGLRGVILLASRPSRRPDPLERLGHPLRTVPLPGAVLVRLADRRLVRLRPGGPVLPSSVSIVHSVSSELAPVRRGTACTVTVHDLAWRRDPATTTRRGAAWHEAALRLAAREADRIVVPSRQTADDLLGAGLDIAGDRVVVIGEGVDHLAPLDGRAMKAAARRLASLGLAGRPYILSVATLEPRKNLRRLLAAHLLWSSISPGVPDLVLVGPKGWGRDLPPSRAAHLAGEVTDSELTGLYAGALAVVYVPLAEGFGLPAAEAMSLGVPVVASSAVPSAAGAAIEVDPTDVESIAEGLRRAVEDDEARRSAVRAGTERAMGFRWREAARAHAELWEALGRG